MNRFFRDKAKEYMLKKGAVEIDTTLLSFIDDTFTEEEIQEIYDYMAGKLANANDGDE